MQFTEQPAKVEPALRLFATLSLDLFCIWGNDGYLQPLNSAWETVLGWSESELRSQPGLEWIHTDDMDATRRAVQQCTQAAIIEYESRFRHKDGSYRWLSWRLLRNEIGVLHAVAKDVTAVKQSETLLQERVALLGESERRFRAVFNQTFQLSSLLTLEGQVLEDNQTAMEFCQLERSQVIGRPFWELPCWTISPETQNRLKKAIAQAAAGNTVRYETDVLTPANTVITIDFSLKPLRDETGEIELLLAEGRDLTERKLVEQKLQHAVDELREWKNRYDAAGQINGLLLYEWNQETGELIWGPNSEQVLGYSQSELNGGITQWWDFIHPEDRENTQQELDRIEVTKEPLHLKYRLQRKDGTFITVEDKGQPYPNRDGFLTRMVGFMVDISEYQSALCDRTQAEAALQQALVELETRVYQRTQELQQANEQLRAEIAEHQQTEAALRNSEEQFRRVFDEAPIGMTLAGLNDRYMRVNRAFHTMLGYTQSEVMALTFRDITHPDELALEIPYMERVISGEIDSFQLEKRYIKKNREILWVNLTLIPLRGQAGEVLYTLAMIEDITERKRALEALCHSEARYRAIIEDQTELICRFKPNGTLTFVNDAYCRYFNKQRSELIGHGFMLVIPEEDQEIVSQSISFLSVEQPIVTYEHRIILPDGEIRWQQWTDRAMFNEVDHIIELQAVGRDITPLKQAEAEIRKALERERELSELRSSFVSLVSHEFRTPLTTILSSSELLERYNHRFSEEKKQTHHQRIQIAVTRMTQLLDDVLTIGKAEAGKLQFNPAPMDLVAFCQEIIESMQIGASQEHRFNFTICGDCTDAQMDEHLLRHVLTNLLSNAVKYSPQGGEVKFDLMCDRESMVFRIQDSGIGIPPEDLDHLFNSFQRARNVGSIQGTGLGLAIVKKCVDLHGGQITVESEMAVGTTFTVTLPLHQADL
ncbi:PAS domain S-box protein [Coleofasciculus sp. LEGE 07092]|uniref:PAS domain S-box protein n=2 Tax=unclassified Coleofasciculus TaxID=2692782 RepID=UPI001A02E140|nr:PAS domain S-box protein [Coleofasciculus sp. LEGE 07092]MBE9128124.1 PAS domain S-box protein [Coleofasciculus sp. LEGE 07081]